MLCEGTVLGRLGMRGLSPGLAAYHAGVEAMFLSRERDVVAGRQYRLAGRGLLMLAMEQSVTQQGRDWLWRDAWLRLNQAAMRRGYSAHVRRAISETAATPADADRLARGEATIAELEAIQAAIPERWRDRPRHAYAGRPLEAAILGGIIGD